MRVYCVRQGLSFNKHGQVRFNPWKLIDHGEVMEHWGHIDFKSNIDYKAIGVSPPFSG